MDEGDDVVFGAFIAGCAPTPSIRKPPWNRTKLPNRIVTPGSILEHDSQPKARRTKLALQRPKCGLRARLRGIQNRRANLASKPVKTRLSVNILCRALEPILRRQIGG
jgi:hypothetical protein